MSSPGAYSRCVACVAGSSAHADRTILVPTAADCVCVCVCVCVSSLGCASTPIARRRRDMTRTSSRRTSRAPSSRLITGRGALPGSGVRSESKKSGRRLSSWGAYRSYVTSSSGHRLTPVSGVWARQSRSTISGRRSRRTSPPCIVRKTAGCAALWSLLRSSYRTTGASSSRLTTRSTGAYAKSSAPSRKRCAPARIGRHAPLLPRIH